MISVMRRRSGRVVFVDRLLPNLEASTSNPMYTTEIVEKKVGNIAGIGVDWHRVGVDWCREGKG